MEALTTVFGILLVSSFGLFTGMPPLPEDPLVERIAPADTLLYFSWAGSGQADPKSANKTELMLADEEFRVFIDGLKKRFSDTKWLDNLEPEQTPEQREMGSAMFELAGIVMTRPAAGFISDMKFEKKAPAADEPAEDAPPMDFAPPGPIPGLPEFDLKPQYEVVDFSGAFIFNAGDRAARVSELVEKLLAASRAEAKAEEDVKWSEAEEITIGGLKMQTAKSSKGQEAFWGSRGPYFYVAIGRKAIEEAVAGLSRKRGPPAWFTDMKAAAAVKRPSYRWYVNAGRLFALVETQADNEKFTEALEASGLVHLKSIASVTGFDDVAMTTKTLYALQGDPQEYLKFLPNKPLTVEDFKNIPADASWACAGQFDFEAVYEALSKLEELAPAEDEAPDDAIPEDDFGLEPAVPELTPEQKEMIKKLAKQITTAIGPTWRLYNAPSDGGFLFTGMTAVVEVKRDQELRAALANVVVAAQAAGYDVKTFTFRSEEVTYLRQNIATMSFGSSAWVIADGKLVWALYPQVIKSYLSRTENDKTLADHPNVRRHLTGDDAPLAMTYVDTPGYYQTFYSLFQILIPFIDGGLKAAEIDYPMHEIPSAAVIRKYVQPSITTVRRDERGIVTESQKSLPLGGGTWFTLSLLSGMAGADAE